MNRLEIIPLNWDTDYFRIKCGKVVIFDKDVNFSNFDDLCKGYDFVSIQNCGNNISVNREIAEKTSAYLVDINVQFEKVICNIHEKKIDDAYKIIPAKNIEEKIMMQMSVEENDFEFSKFICDDELKRRNGYLVYKEWIKNACKEQNKYFVIFFLDNTVGAYILFSIDDNKGKIELVKVNRENQGKYVATEMIRMVEKFLFTNGIKTIRVGTQFNNIPAMNLYHFLGYKEISRTSVFHYWLQN